MTRAPPLTRPQNLASLSSHALALANIALLGAPFSAFLVIPYALVGRAAKATDGGAPDAAWRAALELVAACAHRPIPFIALLRAAP